MLIVNRTSKYVVSKEGIYNLVSKIAYNIQVKGVFLWLEEQEGKMSLIFLKD